MICFNQKTISKVRSLIQEVIMSLSSEEIESRTKFYGDKLGKGLCSRALPKRLWPVENWQKIMETLTKRGFEDPVKVISSHVNILSYSIDSINSKIIALSKCGFEDPVKVISSHPSILGYSIDSINSKIIALSKCGFEDPVKMISSHQPILGLSMDKNIKPKLKLLGRLGIDIPTIESWCAQGLLLPGMAIKHYLPMARYFKRYGEECTHTQIMRLYKNKAHLKQ